MICYSTPPDLQESLIREFREHCPKGRIVGITNGQVNQTPDVDAFVFGLEVPEVLIDAIQRKAA